MNRFSVFAGAFAISFTMAGAASAQYAQGPVSAPGSGDSSKISNANRENNAEYNRLIGATDAKAKDANAVTSKPTTKAVPASIGDIKPGAALRDVKGVPVGTIDSVADQQIIVNTGQAKIGVPLIAFGKDDKGLLLSITAQQFSDAVAKAHARSQQAQAQQPH